MKRVLVVSKKTKLSTLSMEEFERLSDEHADRVIQSNDNHIKCFEQLHKLFMDDCILQKEHGDVLFLFHEMGQSTKGYDMDFDVYITLGGDGTVLYTQKWVNDQPIIAVNTDPHNSVGRLCHFNWNAEDKSMAYEIADFTSALLGDHLKTAKKHNVYPSYPRLTLHIGNEERTFLNDVLFTNENPAEMSVYTLKVGHNVEEVQRSSGVWISTAAGSTGGIHSAGVFPIDPNMNALLWKTREPFEGAGKCRFKEGDIYYDEEVKVLEVTAMNKGMCFYIDGSFHKIPLEIGTSAYIIKADHPLLMIRRNDA